MISRKDLEDALLRKNYTPTRAKKIARDLLSFDSGLVIEETPDPNIPQVSLTFPMDNGDVVQLVFSGYKAGMSVMKAMAQTGTPAVMEQVLAQFVQAKDPSLHEMLDDITAAAKAAGVDTEPGTGLPPAFILP